MRTIDKVGSRRGVEEAGVGGVIGDRAWKDGK